MKMSTTIRVSPTLNGDRLASPSQKPQKKVRFAKRDSPKTASKSKGVKKAKGKGGPTKAPKDSASKAGGQSKLAKSTGPRTRLATTALLPQAPAQGATDYTMLYREYLRVCKSLLTPSRSREEPASADPPISYAQAAAKPAGYVSSWTQVSTPLMHVEYNARAKASDSTKVMESAVELAKMLSTAECSSETIPLDIATGPIPSLYTSEEGYVQPTGQGALPTRTSNKKASEGPKKGKKGRLSKSQRRRAQRKKAKALASPGSSTKPGLPMAAATRLARVKATEWEKAVSKIGVGVATNAAQVLARAVLEEVLPIPKRERARQAAQKESELIRNARADRNAAMRSGMLEGAARLVAELAGPTAGLGVKAAGGLVEAYLYSTRRTGGDRTVNVITDNRSWYRGGRREATIVKPQVVVQAGSKASPWRIL